MKTMRRACDAGRVSVYLVFFYLCVSRLGCGGNLCRGTQGRVCEPGLPERAALPDLWRYGVGLVAVAALLAPVRDSLGLLYLGAVLLTSAIELVTGFLMEKLFHQRWWDYSQMPFNIGGYVCLLFSLIWGLACLLIVDVVHPLVAGLVARIPQKLGWPLLAAFLVIMAADYAVTIACVLKLNRRLSGLDDAAKRLRTVSDSLGEGLADGAIALRKRNEALRTVLRERQEKGNFVERRLVHAFPQMRSLKNGEALEAFKEHIRQLKEQKKKEKK